MRFIQQVNRSLSMAVKSILFIVAVFGFLVIYAAAIEPNWIQVNEQAVYVNGLPKAFEGFRIVQISDLHGKVFLHKQLASVINSLRPDLVVITGDVFDEQKRVPLNYAKAVLDGITSKHGIFYVFGNNDLYLGKTKIKDELAQINIRAMDDEKAKIMILGEVLNLIGLNYPYYDEVTLSRILAGAESGTKIILDHRPEIISTAAKAGVDLVLVGHTHGGQILSPYVPSFITVVEPGYEKYLSGLYSVGYTQMYVNRGLGVSNIPLRFLVRPEITLITLHTK